MPSLAGAARHRALTRSVGRRRLEAVHAHSTQAGELCLTLCYARRRRQPQPPATATASEAAAAEAAAAAAALAEEAWRSAAEEFRLRVCSARPAAGTTAAGGGGVRACSVVGSWRKHTLVVGTEHLEEVFHLRAERAAGACISGGISGGISGEVTTLQGATTATEPGAAGTAAGAMWRCVRYHLRDGVWRPQSGTG
jgi:hypothetical protein